MNNSEIAATLDSIAEFLYMQCSFNPDNESVTLDKDEIDYHNYNIQFAIRNILQLKDELNTED